MIWLARIMRVTAIAIAILAAIDPAIALVRADRPVIALIDTGSAPTSTLASQLGRSFDVHTGPIANAAATVIVGDEMPDAAPAISGALLAVIPAPGAARIDVVRISAPSIAPAGSKIPVRVSIHAAGLRGRAVTVGLFAGSLAVDSIRREVGGDDERFDLTLALPPAAAGLITARIVARTSLDQTAIERHVTIDVRDERWKVLVSDARPSWTSTFVRRALEEDRRFDVASRVGTSKSVAVASGTAPALNDVTALSAFDAIVIGAPDALGASDVRSLERYARERGGSVVLLLDRADPGQAASLIAAAPLRDLHGIERVKVGSAAGTLVATEFVLPRAGAVVTTLAHAPVGGKSTPMIWQSPLGAGRVVVNGALDAWRYRTREDAGFAGFWTDAIGSAASASPAALTLMMASARVAPGASFDVLATVRDVALSDVAKPAPVAELTSSLDFWPEPERGVFRAKVKAPDTPGNYEIRVQRSGVPGFHGSAVLKYVVAQPDARSEPALLSAWVTSRGGTVIAGDESAVDSRIQAAVNARNARIETHPMRAVWWLPAFVILLGGEWWIRRRRGER